MGGRDKQSGHYLDSKPAAINSQRGNQRFYLVWWSWQPPKLNQMSGEELGEEDAINWDAIV